MTLLPLGRYKGAALAAARWTGAARLAIPLPAGNLVAIATGRRG